MSGRSWIMPTIGHATLVALIALIVVGAADLSTEGDMSAGAALAIGGIVILLGASAQYFVFKTLRGKHGRA